ncbi:hypothetical protein [Ruania halotolerans]|uniref:hypothetical protein n=1 Tax=Ruania halotolerans TaxID=2897773 RepID=UPI001E5AFB6B|nr:hypothetical protein [Ruania halotolerans]UFU08066.1 hypothetical protein LQF10_08200 [Ruania halotolerans]
MTRSAQTRTAVRTQTARHLGHVLHAARRAAAVVALGAVLALAAAHGLAIAPPATAESPGWQRNAGGSTPGGSYFGNFVNAAGDRGICALDGAKFGPGHPAGGSETATVYGEPYPIEEVRPQRYDGSSAERVRGRAIDHLGYVMSVFAATDDRRESVAADLATIRLTGAELSWQAYEADRIAPGASARADQMIAEAEENAGPYSAGRPDIALDADGRSGTVETIGVRDGDGDWLAGYTWTATITGDATWSNDATTITGTTRAAPIERSVHATGPGEIRVRLTVHDLPDALHRMDPVDGGSLAQRIFPAGRTQEVTARGSASRMVYEFQPTARTEVDQRYVEAGDPLTDHVTAAGPGWASVDGEGVPVTFVGTLYGPYSTPQDEQPTVPDGQPEVGTTSLTFTGPGTQTAEAFEAPTAGFYTWVWTMAQDQQPAEYQDYLAGDFAAPFFEQVETTSARHAPEATSEIAAADRLVLPGDPVVDTVTIEGFPDDHTQYDGDGSEWEADVAHVSHRMYGPFEQPPHADDHPVTLAEAPVAAELRSPAVNGEVAITYEGSNAPSDAGHYVIVTSFEGDSRVAPWQSSPYDTAEMFQVARTPSVVTQAQPEAILGTSIRDTAEVTDPDGVIGADDGWRWSVEFSAYFAGELAPLTVDQNGRPVAEVPEAIEAVCMGEAIGASQVPITDAGSVDSDPVTVDRAGNVFWVERLVREHEDLGREILATGVCGLPHETTAVAVVPEVPAPEMPGPERQPELAETGSTLSAPGSQWPSVLSGTLIVLGTVGVIIGRCQSGRNARCERALYRA